MATVFLHSGRFYNMIKSYLFIALAIWLFALPGKSASVMALLNSSHWVAGLNIPFNLDSPELGPITQDTEVVAEVIAGSLTKNDCLILRDLYLPQNFLLKCSKPGTLSLRFTINPPKMYDPYRKSAVINYGPLTIQGLQGLKTQDTPIDPDYLIGKNLYNSNCGTCHGYNELTVKKGRTVTQISGAIGSITNMNLVSLKALSASDISLIAKYLETP